MSKTMKRIASMLLVLVMVLSVCAMAISCGEDDDKDPAEVVDTYTYNTYTTALGTNWNPHTWENSADSAIMGYIEAPLTDISVKNSTTGEYQWVFVAAESVEDVTAANQADLVKYGAAETDATEGYVYEIKLRPEMKWENGTLINADTYIYSMKAMLDPAMRNYRANNYYSGESAIAGAAAYFNSGAPIYSPVVPPYGETDTPDYSYDFNAGLTAGHLYLSLTTTEMTFAPYTLTELVNDYGANGATELAALKEQENIYGWIPVTAENLDTVKALVGACLAPFGLNWAELDADTQTCLLMETLFKNAGEVGDMLDYDETVGLYKVDDYTIRYVCANYYDYYYFLTSCTSNWLVYEDLYEEGKDTSGALTTTNYATSLETTMSYGAYKIASIQDAKQMIYVQNENYFEYSKDDKGNLYSTTETIGFKVDGEYQPQYLTQKIVVDVLNDEAAKLAFLSGQLDDWVPSPDEVVEYSTSEQLYKVDETYTQRLFFCTDLEKLQAMDDETGNKNSAVMSNENFRKAFSLSIDRGQFVAATAGYKPACFLINSLYFYDVYEDPASIYRNTEEAMQAVCNIYGIEYGEGKAYATLEEAYKSVSGYNLTEAKKYMKTACEELVAAGLYTAGEEIVLQMAWAAGAMQSADNQQVALLNQYINAAAEGSGFGKITLEAVAGLDKRYLDVSNGLYAIGWGAWGGAAFYPFTMFRVYCDAEYAGYLHEASCWDPAVEKLTLKVNGEDVTMTWYEWSNSMSGNGAYSTASNEIKLQILADLEENFIEKYYCIPVCTTTACSMLSYKTSNYTENYSIMYGFGGLRLMKYNYTDAEWAEFVTSQNNKLTY